MLIPTGPTKFAIWNSLGPSIWHVVDRHVAVWLATGGMVVGMHRGQTQRKGQHVPKCNKGSELHKALFRLLDASNTLVFTSS